MSNDKSFKDMFEFNSEFELDITQTGCEENPKTKAEETAKRYGYLAKNVIRRDTFNLEFSGVNCA